ncbi:hypothetical protein ACQKPX_21190 [Photobacterium sp. DNB23_23_1]
MAAVAAFTMLVIAIIAAVVGVHCRTISAVITVKHALVMNTVMSSALGRRYSRVCMMA